MDRKRKQTPVSFLILVKKKTVRQQEKEGDNLTCDTMKGSVIFLNFILFVHLAAVCINASLYDFRELVIWLCYIPIATFPYYLFEKKYLYRMAVVLFFLVGFVTLTHWILLRGPLTASSIFIFLNTNFNEATEFLSVKLTFRFLWLLPYILLFVLALLYPPRIRKTVYTNYTVIAVCLAAVVFFIENAVNGRFLRKATPQTVRAFVSFYQENKVFQELKKRTINQVDARLPDFGNSHQTFVLIIGESANRSHMSLYGYRRNTTPKLEKRNDIIVYQDVISAYSNTINSVLSMFTESNLDNQKQFNESISLTDVFHSSGFKTFWLSNQLPIGIWDNAVYNMAQTFDVVHYTNNTANSSFESTYYAPYDEVLLRPISVALQDTAAYKFIVVHLMGNHTSYEKRYPKKYVFFDEGHDKKTKTIDKYDNAVLYNDFIVDSIFSILSDYSEKYPHVIVSSIYLSDHGENVYDENNDVGHDYSGTIPKSNVEIPFIVWLSPRYKMLFEAKYSIMKTNKNLPFINDDLFDAVMDMNFIDYEQKNPQRSVFNEAYDLERKRILPDGLDYDSK
ncbi:MAG: phosphoethanolamine transferase [Lentimicrobiaceae bacterium]|nr:phosphoethanolamine transferase [Lentimicrobiaceae bacterium]